MPNYSTKKKHSSIFLSKKSSNKYKPTKRSRKSHSKKHNKSHNKQHRKNDHSKKTKRVQKGGLLGNLVCSESLHKSFHTQNTQNTNEPLYGNIETPKEKQLHCLIQYLPKHIKEGKTIHPYDVKIIVYYLLYFGYFDGETNRILHPENIKKILGSQIRYLQTNTLPETSHMSLFNIIFSKILNSKILKIRTSSKNNPEEGKYNFYEWIEKYYEFLYKDVLEKYKIDEPIYETIDTNTEETIQRKFLFDLLNSFDFNETGELTEFNFDKHAHETSEPIYHNMPDMTYSLNKPDKINSFPERLKTLVEKMMNTESANLSETNSNFSNANAQHTYNTINNDQKFNSVIESFNKKYNTDYKLYTALPNIPDISESILVSLLIEIVKYERSLMSETEHPYENTDDTDDIILEMILKNHMYDTMFGNESIKTKLNSYIDQIKQENEKNQENNYTLNDIKNSIPKPPSLKRRPAPKPSSKYILSFNEIENLTNVELLLLYGTMYYKTLNTKQKDVLVTFDDLSVKQQEFITKQKQQANNVIKSNNINWNLLLNPNFNNIIKFIDFNTIPTDYEYDTNCIDIIKFLIVEQIPYFSFNFKKENFDINKYTSVLNGLSEEQLNAITRKQMITLLLLTDKYTNDDRTFMISLLNPNVINICIRKLLPMNLEELLLTIHHEYKTLLERIIQEKNNPKYSDIYSDIYAVYNTIINIKDRETNSITIKKLCKIKLLNKSNTAKNNKDKLNINECKGLIVRENNKIDNLEKLLETLLEPIVST